MARIGQARKKAARNAGAKQQGDAQHIPQTHPHHTNETTERERRQITEKRKPYEGGSE